MLRFHKLHATGNDFLVFDTTVNRYAGVGFGPDHVRALCDRHRGIGADGLIVLALPGPDGDGADCRMHLVNADGSSAEMSGNGIRCLAWVAHRRGIGSDDHLVVDTDAGRRRVEMTRDPATGDVSYAAVDMGTVTFEPREIPLDAASPFDLEATYHGIAYRGDAAGIGNPHLVLFVDDVATARVSQHGPHLEADARFPRRTNVEFVTPRGRTLVEMRVWERGVGETLSCGTGACAAAAVAHRRGLVERHVTVRVPGGDLEVTVADPIRLGGPVTHVFDVDVDVARFGWKLA